MIPVLGIAVLNRFDLLARLLNSLEPRSMGTLWIVDNRPYVDRRPLLSICPALERYEERLRVIRAEYNLGVAASWNLIIRATPGSPYWVLCNDDVVFARDGLARLEEHVVTRIDREAAMFAYGFSCFAVTALGIQTVGFFDENFWPAYLEDVDWFRRATLLGIPSSLISAVADDHGIDGQGSSTIRFQPDLAQALGLTHVHAANYYRKKWGGDPGNEVFDLPFHRPDVMVRSWELDLADLAQRREVFDVAVLKSVHDAPLQSVNASPSLIGSIK